MTRSTFFARLHSRILAILQIVNVLSIKKTELQKVTKSFAYKICTLISLKTSFNQKKTQKICRRICHNSLSLSKENQHRFDAIYHIVNFIFYVLIERNDASKYRQLM